MQKIRDMRNAIPASEKLLLSDSEAAAMVGVGVSYFRQLVRKGIVAPIPVALGKRRLHRRDLLEKWVKLGLPTRLDPAWQHDGSMTLVESACTPVPAAKPTAHGSAAKGGACD